MSTAAGCPVCRGPLTVPATGRRPVYCGKTCRQAAHRARQAAARAADHAAWLRRELARAGEDGQREGLENEFSHAAGELLRALTWLHDLPPASASMNLPGGGWSGWEGQVAAAAREAARLAHRAGDLARAHDRAAADYQAAQTVLRRPSGSGPGGDETPPRSVAPRGAGDRATKHSPPLPTGAEVDRDELFDAIEDVLFYSVHADLHDDEDGLVAWLAAPVDELQRVLSHQDGNGPLSELTAAAAAVLAAVSRHDLLPAQLRKPPRLPAVFTSALERMTAALALTTEPVA